MRNTQAVEEFDIPHAYPFSRKLILSLLTLSIILSVSISNGSQLSMEKQKERVVVIGAGLAGLTTAYRLYQKGYDVQVYEARPRVGGRVHTILMQEENGNYIVSELGAQNISDGGGAQHLISLIKELNLEILEKDVEFRGSFYDGKEFHDRNAIFAKTRFKSSDLAKELETLSQRSGSMQDVLNKIVDDQSIQKRMLAYMLNAWEGLPPHLLSSHSHNIGTLEHMISGGLSQAHPTAVKQTLHLQTLKEGNAIVPIKLAEKLHDRLHLNKVLKEIVYLNNNVIELIFSDETRIISNKLILAIPCSVYQDIIFDSRIISTEKLETIKKVRYGTNGKILTPVKNIDSKERWIFTDTVGAFFNFNKTLLILYFVNDDGMNLFGREEFDKALSMLKIRFQKAFFNEETPSEIPDFNYVKTNIPVVKSWVKDEYAKGSYSTYDVILQDKFDKRVFYRGIEMKEIFSPINDHIFFVGEHATLLDELGTMEAAVESGERIAKLF